MKNSFAETSGVVRWALSALVVVALLGMGHVLTLPAAHAAQVNFDTCPVQTNYATHVVASTQGYTGQSTNGPTIPGGEHKVLGAPEGHTSVSDVNFDSQGNAPGFVTVGFAASIVDRAGSDFRIHFNDLDSVESFEVLVSEDGSNFRSLGLTSRQGAALAPTSVDFDLAGTGLTHARFVKVVNGVVTVTHNTQDPSQTNEGPDIDGFEILSCGIVVTTTPTPTPTPSDKHQCEDGKDNDHDGFIDRNDPDCYDSNGQYDPTNDEDNHNDHNQCVDGKDNDGDGKIDQADPDCHTDGDPEDGDDTFDPTRKEDTKQVDECDDNADNEGDGFEDEADPDCYDSNGKYDRTNKEDTFNKHNQCIDRKDNDGDKLIDFSDPDCHTDGDATDGDDTFDGSRSENKKQGQIAAVHHIQPKVVHVPVTARTGASAIPALAAIVTGAGVMIARKFS